MRYKLYMVFVMGLSMVLFWPIGYLVRVCAGGFMAGWYWGEGLEDESLGVWRNSKPSDNETGES